MMSRMTAIKTMMPGMTMAAAITDVSFFSTTWTFPNLSRLRLEGLMRLTCGHGTNHVTRTGCPRTDCLELRPERPSVQEGDG